MLNCAVNQTGGVGRPIRWLANRKTAATLPGKSLLRFAETQRCMTSAMSCLPQAEALRSRPVNRESRLRADTVCSEQDMRGQGRSGRLGTAGFMAGVVGFEPTHGGTKNRCLTTWLHPNALPRIYPHPVSLSTGNCRRFVGFTFPWQACIPVLIADCWLAP